MTFDVQGTNSRPLLNVDGIMEKKNDATATEKKDNNKH